MEDFKTVKNNLDLGFISYSEFIEQWKDALHEHGLILSFEMDKKLNFNLEFSREAFGIKPKIDFLACVCAAYI